MASFFKKWAVTFLLMAGVLTTPALAAGQTTGTAQIWDHRYYVEGQVVCCNDANGQMVPLLEYQDSVYLPVRTAGEWMGKTVGWDASTHTVTLSGTVTPIFDTEIDISHSWSHEAQTITVAPEISVVVDGTKQALRAADGSTVYPLLYRDTTYLPLRAIGELMGKEVTWIEPRAGHPQIYIRTELTAAQKQEAEDYLSQATELFQAIQKQGAALSGMENSTPSADAQKTLDSLMSSMQSLKNLSAPAAPVMQASYNILQDELANMLGIAEQTKKILQESQTAEKALDYLFERDADDFLNKNILQGNYLNGALVRMHTVLYQDGSAYEV